MSLSKILKTAAAGLGIVAVIMMFLPQVVIHWNLGGTTTLGVQALVGGSYPGEIAVNYNGVGAGLAGYILVGVAALLFLACGFVAFFSDHDILNILAMGVGIICAIIGTVLLFMIRRNFAGANGFNSKEVFVGVGAIIGGSLASLSAFSGLLGLITDFAK
ncbi:MAG: hypothetical protein K6F07_00730 [Bacilli bacterium]|nr:hypothetical protein [Bacilli bacterium]